MGTEALEKDGAVFVNERAKTTALAGDLALKKGQIFLGAPQYQEE